MNTASAQLLARTQPTLWDVLIAFFGGFAGVISSAKKDGGNVVPGVAIATALMPPLCTVGYGISHLNNTFILGAGYLFLINAFFIALATASGTIFFRIRSGEKLNVSFKQQALILLIAIIIVIPSSISAYSIVHNSYIDTQLSQFIDAKLSNQYIAKQAISGKTIQLSVIGQRLNDTQVKQLKTAMKDYHLGGYQLSLTQLTKGNYITPKEFQDYMKQTDSTDTAQTNTNATTDGSLTSIQNDLNEKYAKDISNIYVGQVKDTANTSKQLIVIRLSDKGQANQTEIKKSANQLVKDNNVDAVVQFVSGNKKS